MGHVTFHLARVTHMCRDHLSRHIIGVGSADEVWHHIIVEDTRRLRSKDGILDGEEHAGKRGRNMSYVAACALQSHSDLFLLFS